MIDTILQGIMYGALFLEIITAVGFVGIIGYLFYWEVIRGQVEKAS